MQIATINQNIDYVRTIEGMGDGLVLFKVKAKEKAIGQNFHYYYEDKRKPPLDLAINPRNNAVEYISFFAQDELVMRERITERVFLNNNYIKIICEELSENSPEITEAKEFLLIMDENDIYAVDKVFSGNLFGYKLNNNNYVLFDNDKIFRGVVLKNLLQEEFNEIKKSKSIERHGDGLNREESEVLRRK